MSISNHSNGLVSTIEFRYKGGKQDKRLNNHHFHLNIPQQTKHNYGDPLYAASKWYSIKFHLVLGMQLTGGC